jgi:hypothetical protein
MLTEEDLAPPRLYVCTFRPSDQWSSCARERCHSSLSICEPGVRDCSRFGQERGDGLLRICVETFPPTQHDVKMLISLMQGVSQTRIACFM